MGSLCRGCGDVVEEDDGRGCGRCAKPEAGTSVERGGAATTTSPGSTPGRAPDSWAGVAPTWGAFASAAVVFGVFLAVGAGPVAAIVAAQVAWALSAIVDGIRNATGERRPRG